MQYDLIIAGAGLSGLSLVYHLRQHDNLKNKTILLIDKAPKTQNDRTWSFWEAGSGVFEHLVAKKWKQVFFYSNYLEKQLDMHDYAYKMIRGIDFYQYMNDFVAKDPNVTVLYGDIQSIKTIENKGIVTVNNTEYVAEFVCSSIYDTLPQQAEKHYLLQHFKGWIVRTKQPSFDAQQATLMDFRVAQEGDCRFVYVLPTDAHTAMIEYTVFSDALLEDSIYDTNLKNYIHNYLKINDYEIEHVEFGVIPMTNASFEKKPSARVLTIGTAGGNTKPSTGYTYQTIQKNCTAIAAHYANTGNLENFKALEIPLFELYDSTLLRIMAHKKLSVDAVFSDLFQKNPASRILRFLDNETTMSEDIKIMSSVPILPFLKAAIQEGFLQIFKK
jgi:lycopene beta-cyclase